jgi:hypothetical protein
MKLNITKSHLPDLTIRSEIRIKISENVVNLLFITIGSLNKHVLPRVY